MTPETKSCPEGAEEKVGRTQQELAYGVVKLEMTPHRESDEEYRFVRRTGGHSVLLPAHFDAILSPVCAEKNKRYYECAANAYRTAKEEGCLAAPSCEGAAWLGR